MKFFDEDYYQLKIDTEIKILVVYFVNVYDDN